MMEWVEFICCRVKVVKSGNLMIMFNVLIVSVGMFEVVGCVWWSNIKKNNFNNVVIVVCVLVKKMGLKLVMVICVVGKDFVKIVILINLFI